MEEINVKSDEVSLSVKEISCDEKKKIHDKSPAVLSDYPNMSASELRSYFHKFVTDSDGSVLALIDRVIEDVNACLNKHTEDINGIDDSCDKAVGFSSSALSTAQEAADFAKTAQEKLPVNNSGSSNRIWVATPNKFNGERGVLIGAATFNKNATVSEDYSPIITNIDKLTPADDVSYAVLARVAELYTMENGAYSAYIKSGLTLTGSSTSVKFYWTYPYYFKRFVGGGNNKDATSATASGPKVGVVTMSNYFTKWSNGEINAGTPYADYASDYKTYLKNYYQYRVCRKGDTEPVLENAPRFSFFTVIDNEEPFDQNLVVRDEDGRIVIEDGAFDFHAVNIRQLNATGDDTLLKAKKHTFDSVNRLTAHVGNRFKETNVRLENLESATLKYIEDSSVAYQKIVPSGVAKRAIVSKVGGMSYTLCNIFPLDFEGEYETEYGLSYVGGTDGGITITGRSLYGSLLGFYEYIPIFCSSTPRYLNGTYTVSLNKALPMGATLVLSNANSEKEILAGGKKSNTFSISDTEYNCFAIRIARDVTFSGETYYPMVNEGWTALPYFLGFQSRDAKATNLLSTGANWWPHGDISVEKSGKYDLKLPAGKYTFSFDASCDDFDSNYSGIRLIRSNGPSTKIFTFERDKRVNITISCQDIQQIMFYASENAELSVADTLHISNMMINLGETALPYEPYRIVDTLSIPEKIQENEGYGQGNPNNADEYNYIDFEKKTFVALGHIVDGVWVAYEKPDETDISAYLTDDNAIEVEAGGTIKVVNDNNDNHAVPTTICYVTKKGD